ncbi:MAG: hypothetical protein ABSH28_17840 [Acidobacteriota bacterium]
MFRLAPFYFRKNEMGESVESAAGFLLWGEDGPSVRVPKAKLAPQPSGSGSTNNRFPSRKGLQQESQESEVKNLG